MNIEQISTRLNRIIAEQLGLSDNEIKPENNFINDLGADSLDTVELIMAIEDDFDISIPDEAAEKITTVQEAIDYIVSHPAAV